MADRRKGMIWFIVITVAVNCICVLGIYLLGILPGNPLSVGAVGGAEHGGYVRFRHRPRGDHAEGFKDAGLRLDLKAVWLYYLCALLFPVVLAGVAVALGAATPANV